MTVRPPTIAALGGGGFSQEPDNDKLDRWLLSLTNVRNPRVLFVPTASGDSDHSHYDGEATRRPTYQRMVAEEELLPGIAADDGIAVLYRGVEIEEVVASGPGKSAWSVATGSSGTLTEKPLEARQL